MIICKEPGNNIIPKPKNTINTLEIKRIIQGYGTKSFEKHKGLFKKRKYFFKNSTSSRKML